MNYKCRISDAKGKISRQTIQADSYEEVQARITSQGLYLLSVDEERGKGRLRGRQSKAVLELTQSLALMIQSGLTLKEAFEVAGVLFTKGKTAQLVEQLNSRLRKGDSFSQSIEEQKEIFPPLYLGMIRVGQQLGQLDSILPALANWLEKRKEIKDKIGGAFLYPSLVVIMVLLGITALLIFFLPFMEEMLSGAGDQAQQNLEQAYTAAKAIIIIFISLVVLIPISRLFYLYGAKKNKALAVKIDMIKLQIPLYKSFLFTQEMLSLSFALTVLTSCGVTLEEALLQSADVLENRYIKESLINLQGKLLRGQSLSVLLSENSAFPPEFSRWVGLGESIGQVDKIFGQLKQYYQKEMDKKISLVLTLAEPTVIIFLGILLAIIVIKVIVPLLTTYGGV